MPGPQLVCVYQFKVVLRGIRPMMWRRLLLRSDHSVADLHYAIQIAMGWSDSHLHQFHIHGKDFGVEYEGGVGFSDDDVAAMPGNGLRTDRMADLQDRIQTTEQRIAELHSDLDILNAATIAPQELKQALEAFDPVWKTLNTSEQSRIIRALVERIGYDGRTGKIAVTFRSAGFKTLCEAVENNADKQ